MADSFDSTPGSNQPVPGMPGQPGAPAPVPGHGLPTDYESPVFDLHPDTGQPITSVVPDAGPSRFDPNAPTPGGRVVVGEETIAIAPHPTTNRFPWAPVENPTVPIYGSVVTEQPAPPPPLPTPVPQPVPQPLPQPAPQPEPIPIPEPPPPAPVVALPPPSPIELTPQLPAEPASLPEPEPTPPPPPMTPLPEPEPELKPEPAPGTTAPLPVEPVAEPTQDILPPPPVSAAPPPEPTHRHGPRIFSEHTRTVWRILRPNKMLKLFYLLAVVIVIAAFVVVWVASGASFNPDQLPFMDRLLTQ